MSCRRSPGPTRRGWRRMGAEERRAVHVHRGRRTDARCAGCCSFRRGSIRRRAIRCWSRCTAGRSSTRVTARETFVAAEPARRVRVPDREPRLARRAGPRQAHPGRDLPEARAGGNGRHGGGRQGAVEPAVRRQEPRRHLRHVVRRLHRGDGAAAPSRRSSRPRPPRRRRPTGATTTRSTPSATCGCRRRTRRATTPAAR